MMYKMPLFQSRCISSCKGMEAQGQVGEIISALAQLVWNSLRFRSFHIFIVGVRRWWERKQSELLIELWNITRPTEHLPVFWVPFTFTTRWKTGQPWRKKNVYKILVQFNLHGWIRWLCVCHCASLAILICIFQAAMFKVKHTSTRGNVSVMVAPTGNGSLLKLPSQQRFELIWKEWDKFAFVIINRIIIMMMMLITCMPAESYHKWLRPLLFLCCIFWVLMISLVLITKRLSVLGKPPEIHRRDSCVSLLTQPKVSVVKELVVVLIGQYAMVWQKLLLSLHSSICWRKMEIADHITPLPCTLLQHSFIWWTCMFIF